MALETGRMPGDMMHNAEPFCGDEHSALRETPFLRRAGKLGDDPLAIEC